jgi:hypothetical protein
MRSAWEELYVTPSQKRQGYFKVNIHDWMVSHPGYKTGGIDSCRLVETEVTEKKVAVAAKRSISIINWLSK